MAVRTRRNLDDAGPRIDEDDVDDWGIVVADDTFRSDQSEQHDKLLLNHTKIYIRTRAQGRKSRTSQSPGPDRPLQLH